MAEHTCKEGHAMFARPLDCLPIWCLGSDAS
jgi:hypothetical protein